MRSGRSILVLTVVFAALVAYAYFVASKTPDGDKAKRQEKVFASLDANKIEEIRLKSTSGEATTLKKDSTGWQVTEPVTAKADITEVGGLSTNLSNLELVRVIDENPSDLKDYGLTSPRLEIALRRDGAKEFQALIIGDKTPTGADVFAKRRDEKRVFVIPAFQESSFNRSTFDLRDKKLLTFDRAKVDGLETVIDGKTIQIAKDGSDWTLTAPVHLRADPATVDRAISRLQTAQAKSIVVADAGPADLKKYGLDRPVSVTVKAGNDRATLLIGGRTPDNMYYARDSGRPWVVTVDAVLAEDVTKSADGYRRKDLFAFRSYTASRVEITRDGQTYAFEVTKSKENPIGKWRRTGPTAGEVDKDKFEVFLSKLTGMRAIGFPPAGTKTGLDKPSWTVFAKFDENKEERVTLGKAGNDVYAMRPGDAGPVQASAADFQSVSRAMDEVSK